MSEDAPADGDRRRSAEPANVRTTDDSDVSGDDPADDDPASGDTAAADDRPDGGVEAARSSTDVDEFDDDVPDDAPALDAFEEQAVDTDAVDAAEAWAAIEEDDESTGDAADVDGPSIEEPTESAAVDDSGEVSESAGEADAAADGRIVSDRTCHGCRFFADPPEFGCTHEGTEIRRVVDADHFEVVDCPMVLDDVDVRE